ncbi:MAG: hypothetical protein ACTHNS_15575 [Marmoricola sp.]
MDQEPDDRHEQIRGVVRRGLVLLLACAAVVAAGTYVLVHALGLNNGHHARAVVGRPAPITPLPTTALPVPGDQRSQGAREGSDGATRAPASSRPGPRHHRSTGLHLDASPSTVGPMQRINLTGTWPGHDNVGLQVQRLGDGGWQDFPTTTTVQVGTFATYVETQRSGPNAFRVVDPDTHTASNSVTVTVR